MAWYQSNDKHIYAKNGIDNWHIYVSEIAMKNILIVFYFIAKHQCQKTKKMAVNIFHSAANY